MTTKNLTTLITFGVRILGGCLLIWGTSKEAWIVGAVLALGGEPSAVRTLFPATKQ